MSEYATYYLYAIGWRLIRFLPERTAYSIARKLGGYFAGRGGKQVNRLRRNLKRVLPHVSESQLDDVVADGMRSYLRYWCDTFRFSDWDFEKIRNVLRSLMARASTDRYERDAGLSFRCRMREIGITQERISALKDFI